MAAEPKKVSKAVEAAIKNGAPNVDLSKLPDLTDMSADNITDNVLAINSLCANPRLKFVMESLVKHLHSFAREVSLTTDEWMTAIQFLTQTGQACTDIRQEFILLSDVFGLSVPAHFSLRVQCSHVLVSRSALVDAMNHPKPAGATEATVLGPFFTEDAKDVPQGESIASEGKGEYMYVRGQVKDLEVSSVTPL